mmetsp:Transcript_101193/g.241260  ORF Transcript_101193/g.241260 Transcript_101193/m.241260 type:complete len:286 (-) Transcript_101193:2015-2872(-)
MALDHLLDLGVSELVFRIVMPSGDLHVVLKNRLLDSRSEFEPPCHRLFEACIILSALCERRIRVFHDYVVDIRVHLEADEDVGHVWRYSAHRLLPFVLQGLLHENGRQGGEEVGSPVHVVVGAHMTGLEAFLQHVVLELLMKLIFWEVGCPLLTDHNVERRAVPRKAWLEASQRAFWTTRGRKEVLRKSFQWRCLDDHGVLATIPNALLQIYHARRFQVCWVVLGVVPHLALRLGADVVMNLLDTGDVLLLQGVEDFRPTHSSKSRIPCRKNDIHTQLLNVLKVS